MLLFEGRSLCIVTQHKKERVIQPVLEQNLGVKCFVPDDFNTDVFGTFTNEIGRKLSAAETVKQKVFAAMQKYDCELFVASEGSFGSHPVLGFLPCDEEILFFYDKVFGIEIFAKELSTQTNFSGEKISEFETLVRFAEKIGFPSHALILKDHSSGKQFKGISSWEELKNCFDELSAISPELMVETDMRAMNNPSRMKVIEACSQKLVRVIKSLCPVCGHPGFSVKSVIPGLPCEECGLPTDSTQAHVFGCDKCEHQLQVDYPNNKLVESAMYCNFCNP